MPKKKRPGIDTIAELREHLAVAMQLEHATIPPYFTAWLSIREGHNYEAAQIIRSVMLEEMLHLTLAANVLNAIGGKPKLTSPGFVPRYPHRLPHSGARFKVSIERFSPGALQTFLKIERPEPRGARPEPGHYDTIGQFYAAIRVGLDHLCDTLGEKRVFTGKRARQVRPEDYYGSGAVVVVTGRDTAHQALDEIVEQGEGAHHTMFDHDRSILGGGGGHELAHYYRFMEVVEGRRYKPHDTPKGGPTGARLKVDYTAVCPIRANTRPADFPRGSAIRGALEEFVRSYGRLLRSLERSFNGAPSQLMEATARMFALKAQALALMNTPSGDGETTVGLAF